MEKINRHNYEAYFLDYIEGNLGAEEQHDLFVFLEQNPDLKAGLDLDLTEISLNPSAAVFENKPALKVDDDAVLSMSTAETWMIESVEGNLTASKQQELEDFIRKHQLEKTYTAYQSTILKADLSEVYEDKQKLKIATGLVIPLYLRIAAVAAVAVLVITAAVNRFGAETPVAETTGDNSAVLASLAIERNMAETVQQNSYNTDMQPGELISNSPDNNSTSPEKHYRVQQPAPDNLFVNEEKAPDQDSTSPVKPLELPDDLKIADGNKEKAPDLNPQSDDKDLEITSVEKVHFEKIVTEEPYKIVTDAASNVTKREVYFTRDKNVGTNEYVAYGFKIGNFEFERKKQSGL
ncbi:MAG: hypothetical protein HYZ14_18660 [Bacteroidetes bacterium]|nr:hypothetical protein [Bacteroidota bacterium]